jgi:hypothetical protein
LSVDTSSVSFRAIHFRDQPVLDLPVFDVKNAGHARRRLGW